MCEGKQEAQQALVTAKVALKSDWLPGINFTAVDTLIGSGLCLETKAGSHRSLFLQGAAMIDSLLSPLSCIHGDADAAPASAPPLPSPPSFTCFFMSVQSMCQGQGICF